LPKSEIFESLPPAPSLEKRGVAEDMIYLLKKSIQISNSYLIEKFVFRNILKKIPPLFSREGDRGRVYC
jgi:hypothetical protein